MSTNLSTTSAMAALCLLIALGAEQAVNGATPANITGDFANPPLKYHTTPLYWLNGKISNDVIDSQLTNFRDKDGYGSVAILPFTEWHQPEFMEKYGHLLNKLDELGKDALVAKLVQDMFGLDPNKTGHPYTRNVHASGGKAYFVPNIDEGVEGTSRLAAVLNEAVALWDVRFEEDIAIKSAKGKLSYIHKVRDNADYYFFANSSDDSVNPWVRLKGKLKPELLNPHTGAIGAAEFQNLKQDGQEVTRIRIKLDANKSVFVRASGPTVK